MHLWRVKFGGVMKSGLLSLIKSVVVPVALVAAMAAFSPVTVMAASRGGGFSGGHAGGFSGGHSNAAPSRGTFGGGGRSFSAPRGNVSGNFNRGNAYSGGRA